MFKKVLAGVIFAIAASLLLYCPSSFADEQSVRQELNQLKARMQALEDKLNKQDRCINDQQRCILDQQRKISEYESRLTDFDTDLHRQVGVPIQITDGLEIGAGATMIIQGTNNMNDSTAGVHRKVSRTDASYSADVTIGKKFDAAGGKAFLHLETGQGGGLEDNFTLYSNVNHDQNTDVSLGISELLYEQALLGDKAVATFGKLDPTAYFDNNDVANDETTQFLSRMFRNSPAIEFPDNTAGMRLGIIPNEWLELDWGVFDGDSDWERVGDNLFNIGQVVFKTNFFDLAGNYRLLGWNSGANHIKWQDTTKDKQDTYGFGLSFDQKASDIVTLFTRYGWQNPKVYNPDITAIGDNNYSLEHSWSAGMQIEGSPWGREKDVFGFAMGQAFASDDYKKFGSSTIAAPSAKTEGHIESYYNIHVNDHLSVSPDVQYIWNSFGKDVEDDTNGIFVAGARVQIDF